MQPSKPLDPDTLALWRHCAETAVNAALDELHDAALGSERILAELAKVSVVVRDDADESDPDLLGMYLGTPVGETDPGMNLPPLVEVYLLPLVDLSTPDHLHHLQPDLSLLAHEVRITVRHEIGHHFGLDHAVLERLGLE